MDEIEDLELEDTGEGGESEEDLGKVDPSLINKAVVTGSDWTADTILKQLEKGNIVLDPVFQRRDAWNDKRKSKFIESIILGLPIPQIVLAESQESKGTFVVIDGKQRLLTLQRFAGIKLDSGDGPLKLSGLEVREDLNGKTLSDLQQSAQLSKYLSAFENQTIRTVVVRNWQNERVLYLIFHRLNTTSVALSPQELRQALHPGDFLRFAAKYSEESPGLKKTLKLKKCDAGSGPAPQYSFDANNHIVGYSYDAAGNLLNDTFHSYTYDAESRVTAVDGGSTASYVYDAGGRVVRRSLGTTTLDFALNLDGKPITELANGTWDRSELYAAGTHVATYADGITYFFHPDWLGSVRTETKYDGTVAGNMINLSFGDGQVWTGRLPSWQNFAQGDIDNASGLDLFMFRQYSNVQGRWISPDPAGLAAVDPTNPQTWNRYAYVANNPLNAVDPLGLDGGCNPLTDPTLCGSYCPPEYLACPDPCGDDPLSCGGGEGGGPPSGGGGGRPPTPDQLPRVGGRYGDVNNETLGLPPGINLKALTLGDLFGLNPNGPCDFGVCATGPDYWTGQLGVSVNYTLPFGLSGTLFAGLIFDNHRHFGTYAGGGAGVGAGVGASGGIQAGFSNGNSICAYGGPFANYSGTFGAEAAGTVDYFEGAGDAPGGTVRGGGITVGVGGGGSASAAATGTKIHPLAGHKCVNGKLQ